MAGVGWSGEAEKWWWGFQLGEGSNSVDKGRRVHIKWVLNDILEKAQLKVKNADQWSREVERTDCKKDFWG